MLLSLSVKEFVCHMPDLLLDSPLCWEAGHLLWRYTYLYQCLFVHHFATWVRYLSVVSGVVFEEVNGLVMGLSCDNMEVNGVVNGAPVDVWSWNVAWRSLAAGCCLLAWDGCTS